MRVILVEVGRERFTGSIDVDFNDEAAIIREVKKHLLSNDVTLDWITGYNAVVRVGALGQLFGRPVGQVVIIRDEDITQDKDMDI